jgi:hypothetical protein
VVTAYGKTGLTRQGKKIKGGQEYLSPFVLLSCGCRFIGQSLSDRISNSAGMQTVTFPQFSLAALLNEFIRQAYTPDWHKDPLITEEFQHG